jgi:uncharacterized protein
VTVCDVQLVGSLVEAFAGAAGDAQADAEQYAALADRELGKVTGPSDVVNGGSQPHFALMGGKTAGLSVERGQNWVTATVAVRWEWN